MQLEQVKALVTGGVSGLGLAVVRHVIANGGKAVMLDINDEAGAAADLWDAVAAHVADESAPKTPDLGGEAGTEDVVAVLHDR
ncbi:MAG: SDR family NAD(P)-dependent oxidoreductase, partial [Xanthomonadales bacterium]|nr:SDR family NAD(P)-dependent oxidoreductase [Xanthomonadales bacterium]